MEPKNLHTLSLSSALQWLTYPLVCLAMAIPLTSTQAAAGRSLRFWRLHLRGGLLVRYVVRLLIIVLV